MNHLKILLAFLITSVSAFALSNTAMADAADGELFGYKIGDSYEITEKTKKKINVDGTVVVIKAEAAKQPEDVGKVYIVTSTMTYTIGTIYSTRKFRNANIAEEFAHKYTSFLAAKYRKHSPQFKGLADSSKLLINFDNNYELRIRVFAPKDQKPSVHISLTIVGEKKKEYSNLIDKEHDQLLIKNAETKGIDKGL
jgi:hypothetical protein